MVPDKKKMRKRRSERSGLCGERESVSVHKKDIRFVEPAGPAPPFEPPRPAYRNRQTRKLETGNAIRPLDPRASRTQDSRPQQNRTDGTKFHGPLKRSFNRKPVTEVSRADFLREAGFGGALFAAAVALGKSKKKKKR